MQPLTEPQPLPGHISLRDLGVLLVKHFGHHEGLYDVSIELGFGAGGVEFPGRGKVPGAMVGIVAVGIVPASGTGSIVIDASKENPRPLRNASPAKRAVRAKAKP